MLLAVQTPQVFEKKIYKISEALAKKDVFRSTDDTSVVEHAGFKVEYVVTDKSNIKLTSYEDVYTAGCICLKRRKESQK